MQRSLFLVILAVSLLASGTGVISEPASPEGPEQSINLVEVEIEETSISIDISFNGSFEGQLHCSARLLLTGGLLVESVDVFLEVDFPSSISVTLPDYEFTLTPQEPILEFVANITVQPGTSSSERPDVTIDGTANAQPTGTKGGIAEDTATVVVLPFYTAEISFKEGSGKIEKGEKKVFTLTIENRGNAAETYILNWENPDELQGKDISLEFSEKEVVLSEGESRDVEITIKTGDRTNRGSYIIRIEVWSAVNGPSNKEESSAVLVIDINDPYLGTIQNFFSSSPYMIYLTIALILIILIVGGYLFLRFRARRAWRKRYRDYLEAGNEGPPEGGPVRIEAGIEDDT